MDNVFIERLWRSLKYEEIYLRKYRTLVELEPPMLNANIQPVESPMKLSSV